MSELLSTSTTLELMVLAVALTFAAALAIFFLVTLARMFGLPAVLLALFSAFCLGFATCGIVMPGASASRAPEDEMRAMSKDITAIVGDNGGF